MSYSLSTEWNDSLLLLFKITGLHLKKYFFRADRPVPKFRNNMDAKNTELSENKLKLKFLA